MRFLIIFAFLISNSVATEIKDIKNLILPKSYWTNAIQKMLEINNKMELIISHLTMIE